MTKLLKPVRREVERLSTEHRGPFIVTLRPDGMLEIRPKGRRKGYAVPLAACYALAARIAAEALWRQRGDRLRAEIFAVRN